VVERSTMTADGHRFPSGACDTHIHVYDHRYPVAAGALLRPPDASVAQYRELQRVLGLERVVVVQPSTYGLDNTAQLAAVAELGASARAVVVVDEHTSADELQRLDALGARGARFHQLPGGALSWDSLLPVAARIAELGWHVQLQMNGRELVDHIDVLTALPVALVVDHVGRFMPPVGTDDERFQVLLRLLDGGRCWVKLSAPYESAPDPEHRYPDVTVLARELVRRAPERMLWASNWPHPGHTAPPGPDALRRLAATWLPDATTRHRVLVDNPSELYGFPPVAAPPPRRRTP
jgi:D-galactarolactone isomerase